MQDSSAKAGAIRILLSDAVRETAETLSVSDEEAGELIRQACCNQEIRSWGAVPLNSHPDPRIAWKHPAAPQIEQLRREDWYGDVNFSKNTISRYRYVDLNKGDFGAWLKSARVMPQSGKGRGRPAGQGTDDSKPLAEIKKLVESGTKPTDACQIVAQKYPGHSEKSTFERLRKKQRTGKIK